MSNQTNNFKDALNLLNSITEEHLSYNVKILSTGQEVKIKQLKTKQQKIILNAAIEAASEAYKLNFLQDLHKILLENCENKEVIDSLTLFDRMYLTLSLRSQISDTIMLTEDEESEVFSLTQILDRFKDFKHPKSETVKVEKNNIVIEIEVDVPTFKQELECVSAMPSFNMTGSGKDNLKILITETYIYEISKFIKGIKISNTDLNYNSLGINQKYSIVENLPVSVAQAVLQKMSEWKKLMNELLTVTFKSGTTKILETDANMLISN